MFADWPGTIDHEVDRPASTATTAPRNPGRGIDPGAPWRDRRSLVDLINTYELEGPDRAQFVVNLDDHASTATVEGVAELELSPIRNPVSGAEVHPEMVLPEGLIVNRGQFAAAKVFRVHAGLPDDHSGKYAACGPFSYSGGRDRLGVGGTDRTAKATNGGLHRRQKRFVSRVSNVALISTSQAQARVRPT